MLWRSAKVLFLSTRTLLQIGGRIPSRVIFICIIWDIFTSLWHMRESVFLVSFIFSKRFNALSTIRNFILNRWLEPIVAEGCAWGWIGLKCWELLSYMHPTRDLGRNFRHLNYAMRRMFGGSLLRSELLPGIRLFIPHFLNTRYMYKLKTRTHTQNLWINF